MDYNVFKMSSTQINHAAIPYALGLPVETLRQAATRRCVFYFPDTPEVRKLIEAYERREVLPIPSKALLNARTQLYFEMQTALREAA